jgi:hypothetical protein
MKPSQREGSATRDPKLRLRDDQYSALPITPTAHLHNTVQNDLGLAHSDDLAAQFWG